MFTFDIVDYPIIPNICCASMLGASGAFPCLEFQIQSQTDNMISYFIKVANYKVTALNFWFMYWGKVEKILKGSLDSILSPSPSVKIQIMGSKICLRCKGETLLGVVNKLLKTKILLTTTSNVSPLHLKQIFQPIIWIFTEGERIQSRLSSYIFSTLKVPLHCG